MSWKRHMSTRGTEGQEVKDTLLFAIRKKNISLSFPFQSAVIKSASCCITSVFYLTLYCDARKHKIKIYVILLFFFFFEST